MAALKLHGLGRVTTIRVGSEYYRNLKLPVQANMRQLQRCIKCLKRAEISLLAKIHAKLAIVVSKEKGFPQHLGMEFRQV